MTVRVVLLGALASGRLAAQGGGWSASPPRPTVGDTIWVSRVISAPAGWMVRPGRLEPGGALEPLGEPGVHRAPGGWLVRYPVVGFAPGRHALALPPVWRLGPDGAADSTPGGTVALELVNVIPDTLARPGAQPAVAPLRENRHSALPLLLAVAVGAGVFGAGLWWRRRAPRALAGPRRIPVEPDVPDRRWLAAGEPKAVAARAAGVLRAAVARAVPEAHEALSTAECLAVLGRARPSAPLRELGELLGALDQVAFAAAHGVDVDALAARARSLGRELAP